MKKSKFPHRNNFRYDDEHKNEIEKGINLLKDKSIKKVHKHKHVPQSFTLVNQNPPHSKTTAVFNKLRDKEFIFRDTNIKDFRALFSGEKIYKPVTWIAKQPLLRHFVLECEKQGVVNEIRKNKWEMVVNIFRNEEGDEFKKEYVSTANPKDTSKARLEELTNIIKLFI